MALYFAMSNAFIGRPSHFIGITNFIKLWDSDAFRQTFQNAFVFTSIAIAFKMVLGIALALLLNEQLWFKRTIRGVVLLPWVIPTALSTLGWWWMFNSLYSVVNWTAIALGAMDPPGPNWLGSRPHPCRRHQVNVSRSCRSSSSRSAVRCDPMISTSGAH